jgi:hypothetical protein
MPDTLVRYDRKGRVVEGGRPKCHFEFAEKIAPLSDKKIVRHRGNNQHLGATPKTTT